MNNYSEAVDKIYALQDVGKKLGLEQTKFLLESIESPQKNLKFIHVAGTNGKGSVCSILSKALKKSGYKVGFYSSPHLVSIRERFRINGLGITKERFAKAINEIWSTVEKLYSQGIKLTYFEVCVAIAVKYFAEEKCDFVVWETGLGGRLDSTTSVNPIITAITGIGIDHEKFLGDTEEKIAYEKAGIIKPGIPVFVGKMNKEPYQVIQKVAIEKNAPFYSTQTEELTFFKEYSGDKLEGWYFTKNKIDAEIKQTKKNCYYLPLPGEAQRYNMKLSYEILKYLSKEYCIDIHKALGSIKKLQWHGRIQTLPDGKILDGAHNPQGLNSLVKTLRESFDKPEFTVIFGCLEGRNPKEALTILSSIAKKFIFIPIDSVRPSIAPNDIGTIVKQIDGEYNYSVEDSLKEALKTVKDKKVIITGSLYLAGETLLEYFKKDEIINL